MEAFRVLPADPHENGPTTVLATSYLLGSERVILMCGVSASLSHSHSCHPLILECDKSHVKAFQRDAVALSIELISELLLQLPIVLLGIHLRTRGEDTVRRHSSPRAVRRDSPAEEAVRGSD